MSFRFGDFSMRKKLKHIHPKIPDDLILVSPYLKDLHESVTAKKKKFKFSISPTLSF